MGDRRVIELIEWAYREGVNLPRPAAEIVALEEAGHMVDLVSGEVIRNGANDRIALTVVGEATRVVLAVEDREGEL